MCKIKKNAHKGGQIAGNTRKEIEEQTGSNIVTSQNAKNILDKRDDKKLDK